MMKKANKINTEFFWDGATWSNLFKLYFDIKASLNFLNCGNQQLVHFFEETVGVTPNYPIRLHWYGPLDGCVFNYEKGKISKLDAVLSLLYGRMNVSITWQSKSGRIYDMADEDIDCDDLIFWFENLEKEECLRMINPIIDWHRLVYTSGFIDVHKKVWAVDFSVPFVECMNSQLLPIFEERTGITINKSNRVVLGSMPKIDPITPEMIAESDKIVRLQRSIGLFPQLDDEAFEDFIEKTKPTNDYPKFQYQKGTVSTISLYFWIAQNIFAYHQDIKWQSKSGRIYDIADEDIDYNDIEFWFDNLDVEKVYQALYPKIDTPFKLKNLSYELKVYQMSLDAIIHMHLKTDCLADAENYIIEIDNFIQEINEKTEKKDPKYAVIHGWESKIEDGFIDYSLKIGDNGIAFLKKLFKFVSDLNCFDEVVMN
ncbi:hypothetical protein DF947_00580 [Pedobacter paludis]|uniref:Uncharacterized protein n=2 Tax=Pedobacter paludis TaxID=2203212 RepID=A0A317F545_9SPHI|nr:hypothetical protein DF947_00580 [Pedobacter paludis]